MVNLMYSVSPKLLENSRNCTEEQSICRMQFWLFCTISAVWCKFEHFGKILRTHCTHAIDLCFILACSRLFVLRAAMCRPWKLVLHFIWRVYQPVFHTYLRYSWVRKSPRKPIVSIILTLVAAVSWTCMVSQIRLQLRFARDVGFLLRIFSFSTAGRIIFRQQICRKKNAVYIRKM